MQTKTGHNYKYKYQTKKKKTEQKRVILYFKGDNKKKEEARTFTCQTSLKQNTKVKLFELC